LTGIAKDINSTRDTVRLTLTKSGWLSSMKYTEYVTKIMKTVISPEVQLRRPLQSHVRSSATVSSSSSFGCIQHLAFRRTFSSRASLWLVFLTEGHKITINKQGVHSFWLAISFWFCQLKVLVKDLQKWPLTQPTIK